MLLSYPWFHSLLKEYSSQKIVNQYTFFSQFRENTIQNWSFLQHLIENSYVILTSPAASVFLGGLNSLIAPKRYCIKFKGLFSNIIWTKFRGAKPNFEGA